MTTCKIQPGQAVQVLGDGTIAPIGPDTRENPFGIATAVYGDADGSQHVMVSTRNGSVIQLKASKAGERFEEGHTDATGCCLLCGAEAWMDCDVIVHRNLFAQHPPVYQTDVHGWEPAPVLGRLGTVNGKLGTVEAETCDVQTYAAYKAKIMKLMGEAQGMSRPLIFDSSIATGRMPSVDPDVQVQPIHKLAPLNLTPGLHLNIEMLYRECTRVVLIERLENERRWVARPISIHGELGDTFKLGDDDISDGGSVVDPIETREPARAIRHRHAGLARLAWRPE